MALGKRAWRWRKRAWRRAIVKVARGNTIQMVTSPTRGPNTLDLFFTTNPTLVKTVSVIPGLSDHDIVLAEVNSRPQLTKQVPRDIPLYKKADWDQLKHSMRDLYEELQSSPSSSVG